MRKKAINSRRCRVLMEELEPRLLFSADVPAVVFDADPDPTEIGALPPAPAITETAAVAGTERDDHPRESRQQRREVIFVDASAPNYQQLMDDLMQSAEQGRDIEVVVLDSNRNGIEQITEALARLRNLDAIHIVSHGSDGQLQLGSGKLGQDNLRSYAHVIQSWGQALNDGADLLIYGCDVAGSSKGQSLIDDLATLTGADVAASTDVTGSEKLGGDWELEYQDGEIEAQLAFSDELQLEWQGTLAVPLANPDFGGAIEGGGIMGGNVLTNDGLGDAPTTVTAANQIEGGGIIPINGIFNTDGGFGGGHGRFRNQPRYYGVEVSAWF